MEVRKLSIDNIEEIKFIIKETFSKEPWNDDWSDEQQFQFYILDLIDNKNSLSLGLYDNSNLIGVSLGRIKHWYTGTEYWIDDLAILPKAQGCGGGSKFIDLIEDFIKKQDIVGIVLFTEKNIKRCAELNVIGERVASVMIYPIFKNFSKNKKTEN